MHKATQYCPAKAICCCCSFKPRILTYYMLEKTYGHITLQITLHTNGHITLSGEPVLVF